MPDPWDAALQAGVDEVGIGTLAGPVTAAAVLLDPARPIDGLGDSKAIAPGRRETLAEAIKAGSLAWAVGWATVAEIDRMNILRASHLAMQRAIASLSIEPRLVLVDGNKTPNLKEPVVAVVQGDKKIPQIGAASILAKVARDRHMTVLAGRFPGYGLEQHKGYATKAHRAALNALGPTPQHRRSFAPVREALGGETLDEPRQRALLDGATE